MIGDFPDAVQAQTPARTSDRPFHGHLASRGLHLACPRTSADQSQLESHVLPFVLPLPYRLTGPVSTYPSRGLLVFTSVPGLVVEDNLLDRVPQDAEPAGLPAASS